MDQRYWWNLHVAMANELKKQGHRIQIYREYFSGSEMGVYALELIENILSHIIK